ncbi:MAG TPA: methyltransferase domain-containing protein [Silvibacterium sp.]|nr:methyltransferase domain-containing protein [Silvibacterium sp.]
MLRSLFNREPSRPERTGRTVLSGPRIPRHSSGWAAMLKHLKEEESLRVLDIGPTSPSNINFLTALGHSCYMADVVHEALTGEWTAPPEEEGGAPGFDVGRFIGQTLDFGGRRFDVVLLWTTLDYIPQSLVQPLIDHLYAAMHPGGRVLAIFHTKMEGPNTAYCRYHLTDGDTIEMQESEPHPVLHVYTNRMIEKLFSRFSNYRFFLAKDNIYEVIITR